MTSERLVDSISALIRTQLSFRISKFNGEIAAKTSYFASKGRGLSGALLNAFAELLENEAFERGQLINRELRQMRAGWSAGLISGSENVLRARVQAPLELHLKEAMRRIINCALPTLCAQGGNPVVGIEFHRSINCAVQDAITMVNAVVTEVAQPPGESMTG